MRTRGELVSFFRDLWATISLLGVIAVPDPDYDARHWWRYSEGVKDVISEGAAYLYAKFSLPTRVGDAGGKGDGR